MTLSESEKDEILDAVADQIADLAVSLKNQTGTENITFRPNSNSENLIEIRHKISSLETKVEKKLQDYEIITNSIENQLNEKFNSLAAEKDKENSQIAEKIDKLRTAIIKLSNEIKEIKVQLAMLK